MQPWPLKVVLDSVIGHRPLPHIFDGLHDLLGKHKAGTIGVAAVATVLIALLNSVASYYDSYLTTSVGQYLAHDLRKKVYHHLQRLSLSYYDHHKIGNILSTITDDINNVQAFFSSSLLSIVIDVTTIVGMFARDALPGLEVHADRHGGDAVPVPVRPALHAPRQEIDAPGPREAERDRLDGRGVARRHPGDPGLRAGRRRGGEAREDEPRVRGRGASGPQDQGAAVPGHGRGRRHRHRRSSSTTARASCWPAR